MLFNPNAKKKKKKKNLQKKLIFETCILSICNSKLEIYNRQVLIFIFLMA